MTRPYAPSELVRTREGINFRLGIVQDCVCGRKAGRKFAREIKIPWSTWYSYLRPGRIVPAHLVLKIITMYGVEPRWLLRGIGPMFRDDPPMEPHSTSRRKSGIRRPQDHAARY